MPAATTRQGLDPSRASHWRVLLSALDERARASGGYGSVDRPRLFAAGFPAATGGYDGSFLFSFAAAIRHVSARYLDLADFNRANAAHPPQDPDSGSLNPWLGTRCPVAGPPDGGLALGSLAMARFMERCADAIEAMVCVHVGAYGCSVEAILVAPYGDAYSYQFVGGDGEPAPVAAPVPGEIRAFARATSGGYHALGTGLAENAWTSVGSVSEPGGFLLFPASPIDPDSAGPDWHPIYTGFVADFFLFPAFAPIQPPSA